MNHLRTTLLLLLMGAAYSSHSSSLPHDLKTSLLRSGFGSHFSNSFAHFIEVRGDMHLKTETADAALIWLKQTSPEKRRRAVDRLAQILTFRQAHEYYLATNGSETAELLERLEVEKDWSRNMRVLESSPLSEYKLVIPARAIVYLELEGLSDVETIRIMKLANHFLKDPPATKLIIFFGGSNPVARKFLHNSLFFASKIFTYDWTDIDLPNDCNTALTAP